VAAIPKALFVDGHSLAYRAFFALPDTLSTAEGQPTNAVLGFAQMLLRILAEEKPDYIGVAFDKGKPEFRMKEYPDYKAQRKPTPDKLRPQFPLIKEFLGALRAPVVEVDGWEGDDILAALTDLARKNGVEVLILTGDRDTLQLLGPGVKAIITLKGISETALFDAKVVEEKYGVEPPRLPDLKGLMGDASDNLPGIPGVGQKTAVSLLARYGTLEEVLSHVDEVTPDRLRTALREHGDGARLCRTLATIRRDVPFDEPPRLEDFRYRGWDADKLAGLLRRLEFRALLRRLGLAEKAAAAGTLFPDTAHGAAPGAAPDGAPGDAGAGEPGAEGAGPRTVRGPIKGHRVIASRRDLAAFASSLARVPRFALAVALDGDRPLRSRLTSLAIAADGLTETAYIPIAPVSPAGGLSEWSGGLFPTGGAGDGPAPGPGAVAASGDDAPGVGFGDVADILGPLLSAGEPVKIAHGAKPFRVWLAAMGLKLDGLVLDTEVGAYLLDSSRSKYSIESLFREFAGQDILLPDDPPEGWEPASPGMDWRAERLCLEADMTLGLADPIRSELADKDLEALLDEMEMPLQSVLAAMEYAGVGVDAAALKEMSAELGRRIDGLAGQVYEMAGVEFNLNSPKQLGEVLFGKLNLPVGRKTSTGTYSTGAEVLEELAASHEIVAKILEHRQLSKLKGTYTDGMGELINPVTGRIHTVFKQCATATGRLSSAEPNLQNIPIREEEGRRIRRVFVPAPGRTLLAGDYSQIELRLMAHLSGDEAFIEAFRRGEDIHQRTASEVFGVPMEDVTPDLRSRAKAVNFGIIYGISDFGLARNLGVDREEAGRYIQGYFSRYPRIQAYVERTLMEARSRGFVTTLFNRRRYLPELSSSNRVQRQMAERAARNTPIQGTAADIVKLAMVRMARDMEARGLASKMILQVHDELLFEVPPEEVAVMSELLRDRMERVVSLDVPLVVDLKAGPNWYEMQAVS